MRVFFASCVSNDNEQTGRISLVKSALEASGQSLYEYVYNRNSLDDARTYSELSELILQSDVYIAEMSVASQTLGFQIAYALNSIKPCLYLYDDATYGQPDAPLVGHPSRLLKISKYNENDLNQKLATFLDYAKRQLSSRRTSFMSTQEIDAFLDSEARRLGVHKAELIRQILHDAIATKR